MLMPAGKNLLAENLGGQESVQSLKGHEEASSLYPEQNRALRDTVGETGSDF